MASSKVISGVGTERPVPRPRPGKTAPRLRATSADTERMVRRAHYHMARKAFPTDSALAEAVGVHRSQITRWKAGDPPNAENGWLLRDLAQAADRVVDHFHPMTAYRWLSSPNLELQGETPLEALHRGRLANVLMVLQAQTNGSFY